MNPGTGQASVSAVAMPPNPVAAMPSMALSFDPSGGGSASDFGGKWNCAGLAGLSGVNKTKERVFHRLEKLRGDGVQTAFQ